MIISFALTEKEFMSGNKTVTRRDWHPHHLKRWQKAWDQGRLIHDGWSKVPFAGGRFLAQFMLTCRPYREKLAEMPPADLLAEGGMCRTLKEFCQLVNKSPEDELAVIRFVKLEFPPDLWSVYPLQSGWCVKFPWGAAKFKTKKDAEQLAAVMKANW